MGLINTIKSWFTDDDTLSAAELQEAMNAYSGGGLSWRELFGNVHPRSIIGNSKTHLKLSAVFCAISTYTGHVSTLPRFMRRVDPATQQPVKTVSSTEHPAAKIWTQYCNDEDSSNDMMKNMSFDVLLDGNYYALKERDSQNRVYRTHYVHPSRVPRGAVTRANGTEVLDTAPRRRARKGELLYRIMLSPEEPTPGYRKEGVSLLLPREEVCHVKGPIPDAEHYRSCGVLENAARSFSLYDAAEQMGEEFYRAGYTNQMYLSTDQKLSAPKRKELEDLVNKKNTSNTKVSLTDLFKTRILEHGLKPVHVGMPLDQIKFIETRAFSGEDVGRWFNIPPGLLHIMMGRLNSSEDYEKLMMLWIQNGLSTFLGNLREQFKCEILPRPSWSLYEFGFRIHYLYRTIPNEFSQALRNLFEIGILDRQQGADMFGIDIDPSDPSSTQRYVPANLVTVEHSKSLENKAKTALEVMQEDLTSKVQDREFKKENHDRQAAMLKKQEEEGVPPEDPNNPVPPGQPPVPPNKPGSDDNPEGNPPNPAEGKPKDDSNLDKRLRGTPSSNIDLDTLQSMSQSMNAMASALAEPKEVPTVAKVAMYNVFHGFLNYLLRVADQKCGTRECWATAVNEWLPKFIEKTTEARVDWEPVWNECSEEDLGECLTVLCKDVPKDTEAATWREEVTNNFSKKFGYLIGEET